MMSSTLPLRTIDPDLASDEILCRKLAGLRYPGFAYLLNPLEADPTDVILELTVKKDVDARLTGSVPWLVARYADTLDWAWLMEEVVARHGQNRLGYLLHLALETSFSEAADRIISYWQLLLADQRSPMEDTYGNLHMSDRERAFLEKFRPEAARYWHVLTNESAHTLKHYALG